MILLFSASFLWRKLDEEILAILLLLLLFFLRGIFHLDGLSDTFDALAYKGCGQPEEDRKKRLEIMKDSRAGVSGITALVINLLLKFLFLKALVSKKLFNLIFLPFFLSRVFLLLVIYVSPPAKKEGLGFLMKKSLRLRELLLSSLLSLFILITFYFLETFLKVFHIFLILCINLLSIFYFQRKFIRAFGGLTGDNFGAIVEISETVTLFCGVLLWARP